MSAIDCSIPAVLGERARQQPDARAYTLIDYDFVLVPPGSIPITTSGKVRRSACAERYRQDEFTRLDTPA